MITPERRHLLDALQSDLIGPYDPESPHEVLKLPPTRWYLTGFLVPESSAHHEATNSGDENEDYAAGTEAGADDGESTAPEAKHKPILPSSLGMTLLLPPAPAAGDDVLHVQLSWGEYVPATNKEEVEALCAARGLDVTAYLKEKNVSTIWDRVAVEGRTATLPLGGGEPGTLRKVLVDGTSHVQIEYRVEDISPADADALQIGEPGQGARAVSVFVVNNRPILADANKDPRGYSRELNRQSLFQLQMEVRSDRPLLSRPDAHFASSEDFDDKMVDLQFRREVEWVVGHGIAATPVGVKPDAAVHLEDNPAVGARVSWIPYTTVARVKPGPAAGVTVAMKELAELETAEDVDRALSKLPEAYRDWIDKQAAIRLDLPRYRETQAELVSRARAALARIEAGVELLKTDPELRQAFAWANRAMAEVAVRRHNAAQPKWHLFQLAFVILNLRGLSDPSHEDRELVELLFFPTGGGKTEAYLGVIATTLILRRMRGVARDDRGLGVAVLLRYTLRLLTLDQLERASALICSLELLRRQHPDRLGTERYAIGLWVGRSGSPNTMTEAKKALNDYRGKTADNTGSPFPLVKCPWCDTPIEGRNMQTLPLNKKNPTRTQVTCANVECEFSGVGRGDAGKKVGELPVLFVDEHIYAELPCFVVSTVDKFALLTHRGQAGKLFGKVHSYTEQHGHPRTFWGGGDGDDYAIPPASADPLPHGLRPPELIVQDELHLISGPLGTMVGLFETLVEELCCQTAPDGTRTGPKILAATATVRRASAQVQALYARKPDQTRLFPPQGVDAWQTFFAERDEGANERMYAGVAATGRSMKRILLNSYLTLLGAGEHLYTGGVSSPDEADPYKTVVGYFNSLRELGGMRRLVDDEVYARVQRSDRRTPEGALPGRWMRRRKIGDPIELTSRVQTHQLTRDKARLATKFHVYEREEKDKTLPSGAPAPVDVLLASNMISVGLDVTRLGLMVVAGQPKTTAEYIQASSRVGRNDKRPGFVLTVYNIHKPRDRSHYEHFMAYHESFYRYVEAQSVTPFSLPALDRALASVVVGMVRHSGRPQLAAPLGAAKPDLIGPAGKVASEVLKERALAQPRVGAEGQAAYVYGHSRYIVDRWRDIISPTVDSQGSSARYCYSKWESKLASANPLMRTPEDDAKAPAHVRIKPSDPQFHFVAPTSMRDVEPSVEIWVRRRPQSED